MKKKKTPTSYEDIEATLAILENEITTLYQIWLRIKFKRDKLVRKINKAN
jgi:hypothetical protein